MGRSDACSCSLKATFDYPCSETQIAMGTEHLPYLDRHICRLPAGPGRGGRTSGNLVRLLRSLDVDDPVSGKKLLRFREHTVRDGLSVLPRPNDLGFVWQSQPLGVHEDTGVVQFLAEAPHIGDVPLQ